MCDVPARTSREVSSSNDNKNNSLPSSVVHDADDPSSWTIKDEYLPRTFSNSFTFDSERFTDNFFIYEEGLKEIIVKDRLNRHIDFWEKIGASEFILDTIRHGYKIPFYSVPQRNMLPNNQSALKESEFVKSAISDLLDRGLVEKCTHMPTVVNPLSVSIQNSGKKRLILDLRTVNRHVWKQSVKYEDLRLALMYLNKDSWMIKFDIHSAYHFLNIYYSHTEYLGFSFQDQANDICFYKFLVLPFGLGVAPYIYTKFTRPLIAKWRGEGKKVIMFLDDGFGTADSFDSAKTLSRDIKLDLLLSGLIPQADKSLWEPVQVLEWLGVVLDSKSFVVYIPDRRIEKTLSTLRYLKQSSWVTVRKVASFVGQVISMAIVIGPVAQIMTRYLSMDINMARTWNSYIKLSVESTSQLCFWENALTSLNKRHLSSSAVCTKIVYSDASCLAYAGYEVSTINGVSHGMWSPNEACRSSTWRELCAVFRVMQSLVHVLSHNRVKWFTDNQAVSSIVHKGSMKKDLQDIALQIFHFATRHCIHLETEWIPREENCRADYMSKVIEMDDWAIGPNILNLISATWGPLDVDYFASEHNAKLPVFYSRFWCYKTSGVDAFTVDWSGSFGLFVPPVMLVARVLKKMLECKAQGVLVVPEWKSASFWPILCGPGGQFRHFVRSVMWLPIDKQSYVPCKNGAGIFGNEDLKFNMLALYIDCTLMCS